VPAFWSGIVAGRSGVGPITHFDTNGFQARIAAQVPAYDETTYFDEIEREMLDRFAQFAIVAADEAWRQAGIELTDELRDRAGVSIGSAIGGAMTQDNRYKTMYREGGTRPHPFSIPRIMNNAAAAHVSMRHGLRGPAISIATACAAGSHSIGEAAAMIRSGRVDLMLAGGADAPIAPGVIRCWEAMRVLAPAPKDDASRACRPFSRDRQGMVLGEGAGVVVLEAWDHAVGRGATILAELAGYGATADAEHITQPGVHAPVRAIRTALAEGCLNPGDIDYVNAHGTATRLNDSTETTVIKQALGDRARQIAVSSTKALHGHAMGASAALEFIATVLAIRHSVLPPTVNYTEADPECDLDYVPNQAREQPIGAAISNSFAFGGLNAVLALRKV
jgi:nodulation protein E